MKDRRGFTLIELLVVIAIIAILAAILFPVFAKAREKARQSSCQSNLKQLALGVQQYLQDYDERLPHYCGYRSIATCKNPTGNSFWWPRLDPYMKNVQILACPSVADNRVRSGGQTQTWNPPYTNGVNYSYSQNMANQPLAVIKRPASNLVLVDGWNNYFRLQIQSQGTNHYQWDDDRHNDGWNGAFVDGHVKWSRERFPDGKVIRPGDPVGSHKDL